MPDPVESEPAATPRLAIETLIVDQERTPLAFIDAALWPPIGAVLELANPNRDATVRDVKLQLYPGIATIVVSVHDLGAIVPETASGVHR